MQYNRAVESIMGGICMKKAIIFVASLFLVTAAQPIVAQEAGQIQSLQSEINDLHTQLEDKKAELAALLADQEGYYTIETSNATYVFSNPRIENDVIVMDMDYTNDSKGALVVYDDMWTLTFTQEDDISINQLWVLYDMENLPEVEGRRPLMSNLRIKSGATVNLVIALSPSPDYQFGMMFDSHMSESNSHMMPTTEPFDNKAPIVITVDQYSAPDNQPSRIEVPFK